MDIFSPNNLVKVKTCYKSVMLTNKMRSFQKTSTATTGISCCHKMIVTCLKAHFPSKEIVHIDYKNFNKNTFLYDLDQNLIQGKSYCQNNSYEILLPK